MDDEFRLDELRLAFGYHIVTQIMDADGVVVPGEVQFLHRTFPAAMLSRSGFIDAKGEFTPRWHDALGEALLQLPEQPVAERLDLVETFFAAALADDEFEQVEGKVMERAARLLGLKPVEYAALIESLVTEEVFLEE